MKTNVRFQLFVLLISTFILQSVISSAQNILFFDDFESGDFAGKGWYDGFPDKRTSNEHKNGSYAYEGHFTQGATSCPAGRHLFTETDKLYISYWVKYSSNYIGSGVAYHPHEWNILTNEDWIYQGPADSYLTLYIEQNAGKPILALQDSKNVDSSCILLNNNSFAGCSGNFSTYPFTEYRSVASCNGLQGFVDGRDCFPNSGSTNGYYSSRNWKADTIYFTNDSTGPYYKNDWHFIETYFQLNDILNGIGIPNGQIRYWYDGQLLITSDSILFRTAVHPNMKFNQLLYGPYIGVGSPVDQTFWIDDLTIADGIISSGIQNHLWNNRIKIFPNPSSGIFSLVINDKNIQNEIINIYNMIGEKIFSSPFLQKQNLSIDISLQPDGIYFLEMIIDGERVVKKVVKG
jgi:Secretion system C-terminal sorting domain